MSAGTPAPQLPTSNVRVVTLRLRTVLIGLGIVLGVLAALEFVLRAQKGLTLIAIALFLAIAINPAVEFFQHRGLGRGVAVGLVSSLAVAFFALLGLVFIPPLVTQVSHFVTALPVLVDDLTKGHGPFGFLERKYHVVESVREATTRPSSDALSGAATPAFGIAKGVATTVTGMVIIAFLTLFMLLEGPEWRRRVTDLIPDRHMVPAERIGAGVYKSVRGFVTGNLLASFLAGVVATVILLLVGVPYALPLGLFTAIVELIPYIGPAVVSVLLSLVALTESPVAAGIVFLLMLLYHLIEGHTLRPLIYGRALQLSALAVLMSIILCTEVAGILGSLAAIPIAGSIQVIVIEVLEERKRRRSDSAPGPVQITATGA
ncbi:MAG: AI-2E family transporter [Dermatophilaceae bacterium]